MFTTGLVVQELLQGFTGPRGRSRDRIVSHFSLLPWIVPDRDDIRAADDADRPAKADALRRAQEDVRTTPGWEHPRFWAAFQLVGAR